MINKQNLFFYNAALTKTQGDSVANNSSQDNCSQAKPSEKKPLPSNQAMDTLLTSICERDSVVVFLTPNHSSQTTISALLAQLPMGVAIYTYELENAPNSPHNCNQTFGAISTSKIENIDSKRLVELVMSHQQTISLLN